MNRAGTFLTIVQMSNCFHFLTIHPCQYGVCGCFSLFSPVTIWPSHWKCSVCVCGGGKGGQWGHFKSPLISPYTVHAPFQAVNNCNNHGNYMDMAMTSQGSGEVRSFLPSWVQYRLELTCPSSTVVEQNKWRPLKHFSSSLFQFLSFQMDFFFSCTLLVCRGIAPGVHGGILCVYVCKFLLWETISSCTR